MKLPAVFNLSCSHFQRKQENDINFSRKNEKTRKLKSVQKPSTVERLNFDKSADNPTGMSSLYEGLGKFSPLTVHLRNGLAKISPNKSLFTGFPNKEDKSDYDSLSQQDYSPSNRTSNPNDLLIQMVPNEGNHSRMIISRGIQTERTDLEGALSTRMGNRY